MRRLTVLLPVAALGVALAGCMGVPVRTDQNSQLLASVHCQSLAWAGGFKGASPLRNTIANPLNEGRLRDAIAANLQKMGLSLVDGPNTASGTQPAGSPGSGPQCLIGYGIGMEREVEGVYPDGWAYGVAFRGRGWGPGWGWGWGWGWGDAYVYHQSYITVDLYDAVSRNPLWHATAETSLAGLTGDPATQRIRTAVDAIFLKFPR